MNIYFIATASISNAQRDENAKIVGALGLPPASGSGHLAIVGGGPSILGKLDTLRAWDGDIWAVNGAANFCVDYGIDAAFYTIDAAPLDRWERSFPRSRRAVVSIEISPSLLHAMASNGVAISILPHGDAGPTSAAGAALLGLNAGYRHFTFFGCESSFSETTHVYEAAWPTDWIEVEVGGSSFKTKPEFAEQAQVISSIIREVPHIYEEQSGGLLSAMVEHGPEYDTTMVSNALFASLRPMTDEDRKLYGAG